MNQEDDTLLRMEIKTHAHMHKLNDKYNQKMVLNRSKWQNPDIASSHRIIHIREILSYKNTTSTPMSAKTN
jgi:hypothetical protein